MKAKQSAQILLRDACNGRWLAFREPLEIVVANNIDDVARFGKGANRHNIRQIAAGIYQLRSRTGVRSGARSVHILTPIFRCSFRHFSQPKRLELLKLAQIFP